MGRPKTKQELTIAAKDGYDKLISTISDMTEAEKSTPFDFSKSPNKKEAHWKRDKNLRDVMIHLYEWHRLLIDFVKSNLNGERKPFLPPPYSWRTYGDMNVMFWQKHQSTSTDEAKKLLENSHAEVMNIMEKFTDEQLFNRNVFDWVGGSTLGSFFIANTTSHYAWAVKKLAAHKRSCKRTEKCTT